MLSSVFDTTKAKPLAEQALAARNLRQDLIASNIANIDTPFYRAKDVRFENILLDKAEEMYNASSKTTPKLKLAQTDAKHLQGNEFNHKGFGEIFLRDGHMARNDANTVDLDVETTEMSKNAIMINALSKALKKQSYIFKSVLDASNKV